MKISGFKKITCSFCLFNNQMLLIHIMCRLCHVYFLCGLLRPPEASFSFHLITRMSCNIQSFQLDLLFRNVSQCFFSCNKEWLAEYHMTFCNNLTQIKAPLCVCLMFTHSVNSFCFYVCFSESHEGKTPSPSITRQSSIETDRASRDFVEFLKTLQKQAGREIHKQSRVFIESMGNKKVWL